MRAKKSVAMLAAILLYSANAAAELSFHDPTTNQGVLDQVVSEFSTRAAAWQSVVMGAASWLFWTLGTISFTWTMGMLALKKADIGDFFAEFIRFTLFFGFFFWLLQNGPSFADSIIRSLRQIGDNAAGTVGLSPSGIVNVGFMIWKQAIKNLSVWSPIDSFIGMLLSVGILLLLAVIAVNMLLLLVSAWILMYAGIFFLGFGGARWTSDMAINYFKTVLGVAVQLFTMILLIGIGNDLLASFYAKMTKGTLNFEELGVLVVFCVALLMLVSKLPPLLASIITGGGIGAAGGIGSFSAGALTGAAMGAAAVGAATAATASAALTAGAANIAGGAQALMAAFSKANAAESASGSTGYVTAATSDGSPGSGSMGNGGSGGLAGAMGGDSGNSYGVSRSAEASTGGNADSHLKQSSEDDNSKGPKDGIDAQNGGEITDSSAKITSGVPNSSSFGTTALGGTASDSKGSDDSANGSTHNNGGTETKLTGDNDGGAQGNSATKKVRSSNSHAAAEAAAAKIGRIATGTAASLAQGAWDVTKAKGGKIIEAARDRIGETTGGKIAAAIKARDAAEKPSASMSSAFNENSLSVGTNEPPDADSEVAAFRDRDSKNS